MAMKIRKLLSRSRLVLVLIVCLASMSITVAGKGKNSIQKECKKMSKQLSKEGWKVEGRAVSLEEALIKYYEELEKSGSEAQSLVGTGKAKSENQARTKARTSATSEYSRMMDSKVTSEQNVKISNQTVEGETKSSVDFDNTVHAESQQRVKNLTPKLTLSRKLDDGQTEIRMYFIVTI